MEMKIRSMPDGTDKVTALAELVYKYAGQLAMVNGANTGEVLLKAVSKCMSEENSNKRQNTDIKTGESKTKTIVEEPSTTTDLCDVVDITDEDENTSIPASSPVRTNETNESQEILNTHLKSPSPLIPIQSTSTALKDECQPNVGPENDKDPSSNIAKSLDKSHQNISSQSSNNGETTQNQQQKQYIAVSVDKRARSEEKDLDYQVICLDDVNDLVSDSQVIKCDVTPQGNDNDKSDDYFDMDCEEIDENVHEEKKNDEEKEVVATESSIDEPDITIIDDSDDEDNGNINAKGPVIAPTPVDILPQNTTNIVPQNHQHAMDEVTGSMIVGSEVVLPNQPETQSVKIEPHMVPKPEEIGVIDIDSDSNDVTEVKKENLEDQKSSINTKPVSIVGFFTNKAKIEEDKIADRLKADSLKVNDLNNRRDSGVSSTSSLRPDSPGQDSGKGSSDFSEKNSYDVDKMNALGLMPIKNGQLKVKYRDKTDSEENESSHKRSYSEMDETEELLGHSYQGTEEGTGSPKMKKRLLDFDKKWHMKPKYSPEQDKYLARPGGIEANVYNGDLTQRVMPAINHMVGTEFRKPGQYTSFSSCSPNVVIETVNSNSPVKYNGDINYVNTYEDNSYSNDSASDGEWEETSSGQSSRLHRKTGSKSMESAKLLKARKNLDKRLKTKVDSKSCDDSDTNKSKAGKPGRLPGTKMGRGSSYVTNKRGRGFRGPVRGAGRGRGATRGRAGFTSIRGSLRGRGSSRGRGSTRITVRGYIRGTGRGRGRGRGSNISRNSGRNNSSSDNDSSSSDSSDSSDTDSSVDSDSEDSQTEKTGSVRGRGKNMRLKRGYARGSRGASRGALRGASRGRGSYAVGLLNSVKKSNNRSDLSLSKKQTQLKSKGSQNKTMTRSRSDKVNSGNKNKTKPNSVTIKKKTNANIVSKHLAVTARKTALQGKQKSVSNGGRPPKNAKPNVQKYGTKLNMQKSSQKDQKKKAKNVQIKPQTNRGKKAKKFIDVNVTGSSDSEEEISEDVIVID